MWKKYKSKYIKDTSIFPQWKLHYVALFDHNTSYNSQISLKCT